jgi:hypothetical protein
MHIGLVPILEFYRSYGMFNVDLRINVLIAICLITYLFSITIGNQGRIIIRSKSQIITIFLLIWIIIIQLVSLPWLLAYTSLESYTSVVRYTIQASLLMLLTGSKLDEIWGLLNRKKLKILLSIIYFSFVITILYSIFVANPIPPNTLDTFHILIVGKEKDVGYLGVSDAFAILTIIMISKSKNNLIRLILTVLGVILLYATFSRTSLYFFIVSVLLFFIVQLFHDKTKLVKFSIVLIIGIFLGLNYYNFGQLGNIGDLRMFTLFTDAQNDYSYNGRMELLQKGLIDLKENWLLGQFMDEYVNETKGGYIHNLLSFWVEYGIVPFILFVVLSVNHMSKIIIKYIKNPNDNLISVVFMLSMFTFLSVVFARSYIYEYIWLAIGSIPIVVKRINTFKSKLT